ncbi:MAG: sugar ABC transporter permease [Clostridia bacterium]
MKRKLAKAVEYFRKKAGSSTFWLLLPYVALFIFFVLIPVIFAFALSLTHFNVIQRPDFTGVFNYVMLLTQDEVFLKYVLPNTIKYALIVGPGGYVLAFLLAWMLTQIQKTPRLIISLILYTPSMVGPVFIAVVWRTMFSGSEAGYINSLLLRLNMIDQPIQFLVSPDYLMTIVIIVALWSSMGIGFLAMIAGIMNVSPELYEAAYIDGVKNRFQEVVYITIPSMKPQMLFGAVMAIVGAFNAGWIGVTLSGTNPTPQYSAQLLINHIEDYGFQRYEMGYAAAVSVVLLLIVWLFARVAYKLFGDADRKVKAKK